MTRGVVAVFGASGAVPGDESYEEGLRCGRLLAAAGYDVATGGYAGLMEAVSRGARDEGGHVVGVTVPAVFPGRTGANPYVTEERRADSLVERIHELTDLADASIALDGSIGTLTELLVAWNLAFVARFAGVTPKPVIAVGDRWRLLVDQLGELLETDAGLVTCVASVDDAVTAVRAAVARHG